MTTPEQRVPDLPEADAYLHGIDIRGDMRVKIDKCCEYFQTMFENNNYKIFLSERKNKEGERIFESLWFFSGEGISEYKNFLLSETSNIDFIPLKSVIPTFLDISTRVFKPGSAVNESTMSLRASVNDIGIGGVSMIFSASGLNCEHLYQVFKFMKSRSLV